jgi:hypothetical protein
MKNNKKEAVKTITSLVVGHGLSILGAMRDSKWIGTAGSIFFTSGLLRGASTVVDVVADTVMGKDKEDRQ